MAHELRLLESKYAPDVGWDKQVAAAQEAFGENWRNLEDDAQDFICTAEVTLHELYRLGRDECDYSAVIVEYAKAFEVQLSARCFDAFRAEVTELGKSADALFFELDETASALSPSERRQVQHSVDVLRGYVLDKKPLTLGQMWHCLLRARKEALGSPVIASLREFCGSREGLATVLTESFVKDLERFLTEFRNHAAHNRLLGHAAAKLCRDLLLTPHSGLLLKLAFLMPAPERIPLSA